MMDGLVTLIGGGGFVGRYVAQALMKAGARVRVAQRDPRQAFFLKPLGGLGQTQFVAADVTRPDTIAQAVAGARAVVNLAGTFGADMVRVQADGAGTVARAAAAAGVATFIHVSAIGADLASPAAYARSKAAGEAAVRDAMPGATILRPSTVFGREDQFINRFAAMIEKAPIVPVLRAGARFQPVFVGDVADAVAAAVVDPGTAAGQTFELGGPDILTMAELLHWIAATTGRKARFLELPDFAGAAIARAGFLPGAPISWDQWLMLERDSVVTAGAAGLEALGVTPTPLAAVAPHWLVRFQRAGRFARRAETTA
ncbi:complex I NDUFA9 subunit family protein [Sphingomonas bacterium]|uniref:complex I NDUFA9 subunit family protein n=1 Tax=Sphingomonas bacterium TaxID=1895847 RepID=UPI0015764F51|nr:complex I NDUFA9 subunit family protein [Sphingomonas bacterium]